MIKPFGNKYFSAQKTQPLAIHKCQLITWKDIRILFKHSSNESIRKQRWKLDPLYFFNPYISHIDILHKTS